MKKIFSLIYFQLTFVSVLFSQDWPKTYPQWNGSHVESLIDTYDKGYMFSLGTSSLDYKYAIIVKTDINGNLLWDKYLGNGQYVFRTGSICQTNDYGVVYCSGIDKYDPTGSSDPVIIKLNSCGEIDWCSVINTPGIFDGARRVRQTIEGNYVLLTSYSDTNPLNRIQLYKFDNSGNLFWKHNYPGDSVIFNEDGYDVLVLNDGYLITGLCYSPDSGQTGGGYERPYYIRTDTAGNELWRLAYGRVNGFHGGPFSNCQTIKSAAGNFYNAGWHSNYCDAPALNKCLSDGSESYYQDLIPGVCPGGDGELNWLYDTTFVVMAGGILNGNLIVKWIKLDTLGIEKYSKFFTQAWMLNSSDPSTVVTFDQKIVTVEDYNLQIYLYKLNQDFDFDSIYTHSYIYDSLCPHQIVSDTIDPNCDLIVSIDDSKNNPQKSNLKIFPNPAAGVIRVELPKTLVINTGTGKYQSSKEYFQWKSTMLEVYDLQGRKFLEKEIPKQQQQLELNISEWSRGLYYFRLVYDKQTVAGEKVIIN